jgi:hypothetical protein
LRRATCDWDQIDQCQHDNPRQYALVLHHSLLSLNWLWQKRTLVFRCPHNGSGIFGGWFPPGWARALFVIVPLQVPRILSSPSIQQIHPRILSRGRIGRPCEAGTHRRASLHVLFLTHSIGPWAGRQIIRQRDRRLGAHPLAPEPP